MSQTFLEKYTVAPAPSRDYYGLKIQEDEVKLFHWPICQRPHKVPITRTSSFSNWRRDTILQSEIEQVFGTSWLQYTGDLIENKRSLLTLPRKILTNILVFLSPKDISQLFTLSRAFYEILNNEETWELIFTKVKGDDFHRAQKRYGMSYGWKQLLKETQDIEIKSHISKTVRAKKPLSSRGDPPKASQPLRAKSELDIKKISVSKKAVSSPLGVQTLTLNIESTREDKPKLLHKNRQMIKSSGVLHDEQLEKNQKSLNILTLQSTDLHLKNVEQEPMRVKSFRATPAPSSKHLCDKNKGMSAQSRVWNRGKESSSSVSSLRTQETLLENSVKKSLSDFEKSKDVFPSQFDWLTGPMSRDDPGDGFGLSDIKWITKADKLRADEKLLNGDRRSSRIHELNRERESTSKNLKQKKCSSDDSIQGRSSESTKASVSSQSVGQESRRFRRRFDLLNSEFLRQSLGLRGRVSGSNYPRLGIQSKNYKL